jgi:hypothetical protein
MAFWSKIVKGSAKALGGALAKGSAIAEWSKIVKGAPKL